MNTAELKQSKFLKKEDVGTGVLVTIRDCTQENVSLPGADPELKWTLHFDELDKPMVLNATCGALIQAITGSPESDDWIGKRIVLFSDPTIMFQGRVVGGIRVRAPKGKAAQAVAAPAPKTAGTPTPKPRPAPTVSRQAPEPEPEPEPEAEDDVPF